MAIKSLKIQNIRNLLQVDFSPSSHVNLICGANGSGKTSLLEAINFLGLTRSFRTRKFQYFVSHQQTESLVFAQLQHQLDSSHEPLGVSRDLNGTVSIRHCGSNIDLSQLASLVPLLVINTDTFQILEGSPAIRRQFVDWGSFHADQSYINAWRSFKRVLQQRNSLLKCGKIDPQIRRVWDAEFVRYAQQITQMRQQYISQLTPDFLAISKCLMGDVDLSLSFSPGWDQKRPLDELLEEQLQRDLKQGYTAAGPQRADMKIKIDGINATERLSRGQKKLVVSALKLAQGAVYNRHREGKCIYLIDDLPSELDAQHCQLFCQFLEQTQSQCFITCVEPKALQSYWQAATEVKNFQIDDGQLTAIL
ncbi:MAG: DNA replication and repair protein RecF [Osedax symbiont Rs1]|nr:MAG: DNA replication and repair protein RecF [Osedax symbiont Rs1]